VEGEAVLLPDTGAYAWGYTTQTEGTGSPPVTPLPAHLDAALALLWSDETIGDRRTAVAVAHGNVDKGGATS
jgi:hypothetical protein